jgi:hypothetical protein
VHCEEFERRLNELLDEHRQLDGDAELSAHASNCGACERLLRDYEALREAVASLKAPAPPADLVARVLAEREAGSGAARWRPVLAALALAATVVVAAPLGLRWLNSRSDIPADPAAQHGPADVAAVGPAGERSSGPTPALIDQAGQTYEPLLAATAEGLASMLDALPVGSRRSAAGSYEPAEQVAAAEPGDNDFAAGFRPLTASAGRSVAALFRIFPASSNASAERGVNQ